MFVAAIAHGVNKGWLDSSFASVALQGWKAVCSQITPEGQVKNVCMGTGISRDLPFYYNRPAPLNDAHGLGAVVQAGIEINNVTTKQQNRYENLKLKLTFLSLCAFATAAHAQQVKGNSVLYTSSQGNMRIEMCSEACSV